MMPLLLYAIIDDADAIFARRVLMPPPLCHAIAAPLDDAFHAMLT